MPALEWDNSYELGIKEFDEHHRHLVDLLNETYDDYIEGVNHETLQAVLDKLTDYTKYHFVAEERWMGLHGYVGLPKHRKEHKKFSRRLVEINNNFHNGKTILSLEVLDFLTNWLLDHILKSDADFSRFTAENPHA